MRYLPVMGKPRNAVYQKFTEKYKKINEQLGKKQYLVPYLMSSHPGSTLKEAVELAEYLQRSWAICRNRYRIFIRHRLRFLPVCIIPVWIQGR